MQARLYDAEGEVQKTAARWIHHDRTKIAYEIPLNRHPVYPPPRPLAEFDAGLRELGTQIQKLLGEVTG